MFEWQPYNSQLVYTNCQRKAKNLVTKVYIFIIMPHFCIQIATYFAGAKHNLKKNAIKCNKLHSRIINEIIFTSKTSFHNEIVVAVQFCNCFFFVISIIVFEIRTPTLLFVARWYYQNSPRTSHSLFHMLRHFVYVFNFNHFKVNGVK